ncbi:MAG TPA: DNA-3-methyladenine glycosylase I, partial [Flavobacteriales bacterium]|nr:DNA-3-methyladenine glycosylase I [Flavobacteriales bacterium]
MSIELKARGFKFICITICYAFMQASGMVNYHKLDCFRCEEIQKISFN